MKPVDMDRSEYRAKLMTAIVCYASMVVIVSFFLVNLLTQGFDSGWPPAKDETVGGRFILDSITLLGACFIVFITVNALYVTSRSLFIELGFTLKSKLLVLECDMKRIGKYRGSSIQKIRDYYWLATVMMAGCIFFIFALNFMPQWISFILMAGVCNVAARRI